VLDENAAEATSISIPQRCGATTHGRGAEEEVGCDKVASVTVSQIRRNDRSGALAWRWVRFIAANVAGLARLWGDLLSFPRSAYAAIHATALGNWRKQRNGRHVSSLSAAIFSPVPRSPILLSPYWQPLPRSLEWGVPPKRASP